MEARLCVTRLFVYCIYIGNCGLEWDWFTTFNFQLHRRVISATITLSSHGAEVGGTSLVPFYCRLGIKSGSGAYSEKEKEDRRWTTVYNYCIKPV